MRLFRRFAPLLLLLAACSPFAPAPEEGVPPRALSGPELAAGAPLAQPGRYRLRVDFVLDREGVVMPLTGLLEVDTSRGIARLVGMADAGPTLLDLVVEPGGHRLAGGIEPFRRMPGLTAFAAGAVRRIFLDPAPRAGDTFDKGGTLRSLSRWNGGEWVVFSFSGDGRLLAKTASLEGDWTARFADYRDFDGLSLPSRIVYRDALSRGALTLRVEAARRMDDGH